MFLLLLTSYNDLIYNFADLITTEPIKLETSDVLNEQNKIRHNNRNNKHVFNSVNKEIKVVKGNK